MKIQRGYKMLKKHANTKKIISNFCWVLAFLFVVPSLAFCQAQPSLTEKQILETNKNLKSSIEENQALENKNRDLQSEIEKIKNDSAQNQQQLDQLKTEKEDLSSTVENVRGTNRKYAQEINTLEENLTGLQKSQEELAQKNQDLEEQLAAKQKSKTAVASTDSVSADTTQQVQDREAKTMDLLSRIDAFKETDQKLRADSAKAHYNMGNIYFQKGEYELAAREYYQAVALMPDDADSHYNLAFVSIEYLNDYKTALDHFERYLYLRPNAPDLALVNEKITHAQLMLRSKVDSTLDKTK